MKKVIVITAGSNSNAMRERIMRTKKRIATLAQTWLVMGVLIAGMMRATPPLQRRNSALPQPSAPALR